MTIMQKKAVLLSWYPWWNLASKTERQIACIYTREAARTEDECFDLYTKKSFSFSSEDEQVEVMEAFYNRFN